ncbi:phosphatidylinositol-specific phospholipase C domain-containing protein [Actinoplanes sp. NPDC051851]|uniref:phosphatidylinositol-specific phospholipase C domain-containing protein n=1 Tax=Actinoplanes sp. NPDC051851 TaxID=3154753 RepID=UPI00341CA61C
MVPAAVLALVIALVAVPAAPAAAAEGSAFQTLGDTSHPDWMRWVPGGTRLGDISVPGTHETLAIHGGDISQDQEDHGDEGATLAKQLDAGIRSIDIRVRVVNDSFTIHHGTNYQNATFGQVLTVLKTFLAAHPTETVLMRLKAECSGAFPSCDDQPDLCSGADNCAAEQQRRVDVFRGYLDNPDYAGLIEAGPGSTPTLDQVRGKVVLTQFLGTGGGPVTGYGLDNLMGDDRGAYVQDAFDTIGTAPKMALIRDLIGKADADTGGNVYLNFTSAAADVAPASVAAGIDPEVLDDLITGRSGDWRKLGVLMMDYPGAGLIDAIIALNARSTTVTDEIAAEITRNLGNITTSGDGDAQARHGLLRTYLHRVAPNENWNTATVSGGRGMWVNATVPPGDDGDVDVDGYRSIAWRSELATSGTDQATLAGTVDAALGGLSGSSQDRAGQLAAVLTSAYPNQFWSVIVHEGDGGFDNWISQTYGVSYQKSADGRAYLAVGQDRTEQYLPDPGPVGERVAYFPSWSVYANAFYPKTLDTNGIAGRLTTMMYAFENIDPVNLTCMAANQAGSTDDNDESGNDGAGDAWADYQMGFTAENSVDGVADAWDQPLKGNFNQIRKLKAKYPQLKVLVSIGGWTYSRWFSDAAATPASRQKFVTSCIDMYIRGNLPQLGDDPAGGTGVAAGVFDGIDIDWEFPATEARPGNHYGPQDTANYTALLTEFRRQLDALGGAHRLLTAAVPAGPDAIANLQIGQLATVLDLADVMSYDMHGGWETTGPTNFQAPLYDAPGTPAYGSRFTAHDAIQSWIAGGFPANKLTLGVPFYSRGWTGVSAGDRDGLYRTASRPTDPFEYSQAAGVAMYKELAAHGKLGTIHFDPVSKGSWVYDGTDFFSVESQQSLTAKRRYIKQQGLAGVMAYSLESDPTGTLLGWATGT